MDVVLARRTCNAGPVCQRVPFSQSNTDWSPRRRRARHELLGRGRHAGSTAYRTQENARQRARRGPHVTEASSTYAGIRRAGASTPRGGEPGCVPSGDEENVLPPPHDHQGGPLSERPVTDRDAVTHVWEPLRDEPSSNGCPCHQMGSSRMVAPRRSAHHMILLVPAGQRPSQRRADDPRGDHESPARDDARGGQRSGAAVRLPARRLWSSLGAQAVWGVDGTGNGRLLRPAPWRNARPRALGQNPGLTSTFPA